jgi:hypothetical protein
MSDMRPKGRGRPQRILLGTWPEEHIRGVIRAVVFRDTQTKDDMPAFVFNRVRSSTDIRFFRLLPLSFRLPIPAAYMHSIFS